MKAGEKLEEGDIIQVNEDGPPHWFRVLLVVDEPRSWGVQAYCTIPGARGAGVGDAFMRLEWHEFDLVGAKSLFIAKRGVEHVTDESDGRVAADGDQGG